MNKRIILKLLLKIANKYSNIIGKIFLNFNCDKFIPQVDLNRFNLKFPCECKLILCDKECEKKYFQNFSSLIENNPFVNEFSIQCPKCKKEFSISNLIDFSLLINEKLNNNSLKESLKKKLKKYLMNIV